MSASAVSARISTRLPVPHLFMLLSIGIFALMAVLAFAPGASQDTESTAAAAAPEGEVLLSMGAGMPVASPATASAAPASSAADGLAFASVAALLVLLGATARAGRMRAHGSGRPIQGLVAGLLAGVAGAASLFLVGAIHLESPTWVYLPLVLSTLGTALGVTAPFRRSTGNGLPSLSA